MKIKYFYYVLVITFFSAFTVSIMAQEDTTVIVDPFEKDDEESTFDFDDQDWNFAFSEHGQPTISLNYGVSKLGIDKFKGSFAKVNSAEIRLGYLSENSKYKINNITKYKYNYFTFSNTSNDLTNSTDYKGDIRTKMWQFGFGFEKGYGYNFGVTSIIPYYAFGLNWSRLEVQDPIRDMDARSYMNYFDESFRFGTMTEGGIKFRIIRNLSLDASYQRQIVMPRLLFWKASGSAIIELIGQAAVDEFVDEVVKSSPLAAPIVNFVLKNALSYGIYELRKEKMNWPFETMAPLTYNTFRVGMTFVF